MTGLGVYCIDCGEPVDVRDPNSLREVIGFERQREQGGQNHVRFKRLTGRWLCSVCAVRRASGVHAGQMTFGEVGP